MGEEGLLSWAIILLIDVWGGVEWAFFFSCLKSL